MCDSGETEKIGILKPLKDYDIVVEAVMEASNMINFRMLDRFLEYHDDIKKIHLGKEL